METFGFDQTITNTPEAIYNKPSTSLKLNDRFIQVEEMYYGPLKKEMNADINRYNFYRISNYRITKYQFSHECNKDGGPAKTLKFISISALKVLYFVYRTFQMYVFLYYTVGILWTAKEEFHCIIENMFLHMHMTVNTLNLES